MTMIHKGDPAPDFTLKGNDDKDHRLSDYRGQKVVLIFYPLDFSPVCTREHACVRDDLKAFRNAGATVFGISVDSVWAHKAFAREMGLSYPLLADFHPRGAVAEKYGVFLADKGITGRVTIIVGPDGRVAEVMDYDIPTVPETGPVIQALQGL
jgi:peroxiredoxin (alkyl hydroperoxide reductase subunit C)